MTDRIEMIAVAAIAEDALMRDRSGLDPEALDELRKSVLENGLRMPIEVYAFAEPDGEVTHGLISGFRRLAVFRTLLELTGSARWQAIPAFVRAPQDLASAMASMIEENEIRAEVSPYERGRIAMLAYHRNLFGTIEEAVDRLYAPLSHQKRGRLRALARLAEEVDGCLTAPERLSQTQALRLAAACRAGLGDAIRIALEQSKMKDPEGQWKLILPYIEEAEREARENPAPRGPGRPRRVVETRRGLTVRRELTRDGWVLRFTGPEATGELAELVMDEIVRMFSPG